MFSIRRKSLFSLGRRQQKSKSRRSRSRLSSRRYRGGSRKEYSISPAARIPRNKFETYIYKDDIDTVNASRRPHAPKLIVTDYDADKPTDTTFLLPETSRLNNLNTKRINIWDKEHLFNKYRQYFREWGITDSKMLHQPPLDRMTSHDLKRRLHDRYGVNAVGFTPPSNKEKSSRVYWNV